MFRVGRIARASRVSPAPWMLAQALLSAAIGPVYVRVLAEGGPRSKGPGTGIDLVAGLALFDYPLSRRLRRAETD